jgi:hypothetical protein
MHLYNYIWVVLLVPRLSLAFLSPKLSRGIDKVLVCLSPCGFDNPRNTLRWKLIQLAFVRCPIILLGLGTTNTYPLTTSLFSFLFRMNTHLNPTGKILGGTECCTWIHENSAALFNRIDCIQFSGKLAFNLMTWCHNLSKGMVPCWQ